MQHPKRSHGTRSMFQCSECSVTFQGILNKTGTEVFASQLPPDPNQKEPIMVICSWSSCAAAAAAKAP